MTKIEKRQTDTQVILQALMSAQEQLQTLHDICSKQLSHSIDKKPVKPLTVGQCDDILLASHEVGGAIDLLISKIRKSNQDAIRNSQNPVAA